MVNVRKLAILGLSLMLVGAMAFGQGSTEQSVSGNTQEKKVLLKLNTVMSNTDPCVDAFKELAENVGKASNGSIEIQVYANSELGSNKDNLEQASAGANIIAVADPAQVADYAPDYSVMYGPFLFKSNDDLQKLYHSEWHNEIVQQVAKKGIRVLAMNWYFGERHIISKKPIKTPEDLKGVKFRVVNAPMWIETFKALGAAPTSLQWSEVYSGLQQGVVDAAEAPLSTIYTSSLWEAAKNVSLTGHFTGIIGLEMSEKVWQGMSQNQQKILMSEIEKEGAKYSKGVIDSENEWKKKLEEAGCTVYEVDRNLFAEKASSTYSKFPEWTPGLYERIKGILSK